VNEQPLSVRAPAVVHDIGARVHQPLTLLFDAVHRAGVRYCLIRDAEHLPLVPGGELDVLIARDDLHTLMEVLQQLDFIRLPVWGHAPHRFFVTYVESADAWLKLDVVTELAFGRPVHNLRTDLAAPCLANRQRFGPVFGPPAEEELIALLLHCVLDKQRFSPTRIARVQELRHRISREADVSAYLARYWSPQTTWSDLAGRIDRGEWEALLAERERVRASITGAARIRTALRGTRDRVLRKLRRAIGVVRPLAPSLALLAPDGAGKSTLAAGLQRRFFAPVSSIYMGLYQSGSRRARPSRIAGLGLAGQLLTQWRRYAVARYRQAAGQLVIFDRYTYDALLPPKGDPGRARTARRWMLAHACPAPDLVVVLDAPGHVLFARKGEHGPEILEQQRQSYLRLRSRLSRVAVVDATRDADGTRRAVTALIWNAYRKKAPRH